MCLIDNRVHFRLVRTFLVRDFGLDRVRLDLGLDRLGLGLD